MNMGELWGSKENMFLRVRIIDNLELIFLN